VKPDLNDLGVIGQRIFTPDLEKCRGCGKCAVEAACPMKAAQVVDGKIHINAEECNHCGRCTGKCPFGAFETAKEGYKIYIGGRWGKKTAIGKPLGRLFASEEEVLHVVEKAICLFRDEGIKGERFADTIERLGFAYVEQKLLEE
jgi:dissimilatory sulfite reductase (desulfoviridin) alpha/beta subunit